jgi:hypothetical protein
LPLTETNNSITLNAKNEGLDVEVIVIVGDTIFSSVILRGNQYAACDKNVTTIFVSFFLVSSALI